MLEIIYKENEKFILAIISVIVGWLLNTFNSIIKNNAEKIIIRNRTIAILYEIRFHLKKITEFSYYIDIFINEYLSKLNASDLRLDNIKLRALIHHFIESKKPFYQFKNIEQIRQLYNSQIMELISIHPILGYELIGMESKLLIDSDIDSIIDDLIQNINIKVNEEDKTEINKLKHKIKEYIINSSQIDIEKYIKKLAIRNGISKYITNRYYIYKTRNIDIIFIKKEIEKYTLTILG
ncbi:hypothetical protein EHQ68_11185 [Leptospira congkakensis]|uniref:Uncharacterized protein n=1 Tax=Leptospira congkakensis TaxID=2484932 RepID=A0A4Z0ZYH1_9LEPT|nr:hypothetical protein [Leptospira congkakensis]TGL87994.1 hypothetical protein EHQ68_11185 [Leptospira congkakensis]TGL88392.1 hypothetical protein EHQ69_15340 [Leptospira congkakensis]TGL93451.1 hypothetical protein EHQ70_17435 [Leptospira congkakensis]